MVAPAVPGKWCRRKNTVSHTTSVRPSLSVSNPARNYTSTLIKLRGHFAHLLSVWPWPCALVHDYCLQWLCPVCDAVRSPGGSSMSSVVTIASLCAVALPDIRTKLLCSLHSRTAKLWSTNCQILSFCCVDNVLATQCQVLRCIGPSIDMYWAKFWGVEDQALTCTEPRVTV